MLDRSDYYVKIIFALMFLNNLNKIKNPRHLSMTRIILSPARITFSVQ